MALVDNGQSDDFLLNFIKKIFSKYVFIKKDKHIAKRTNEFEIVSIS